MANNEDRLLSKDSRLVYMGFRFSGTKIETMKDMYQRIALLDQDADNYAEVLCSLRQQALLEPSHAGSIPEGH